MGRALPASDVQDFATLMPKSARSDITLDEKRALAAPVTGLKAA